MKIFLSLLVAALIVGGVWFWANNGSLEEQVTEVENTPLTALEPDAGGQEDEISPMPTATPEAQEPISPPIARVQATPTPTPAPVFRTVNQLNSSGESGVVAITVDANGRAVVSFNVVGAPAGIGQPAYIYRGVCSSAQEVVYRLEPLINGSSSTTLDVSFNSLVNGEGSLAIIIHKSVEELEHRFACAQLR
ncbi:MAG TPA: hypothetical protein VJJ72_01495 [Candidatus Paceibacterota bacterium]